MKERLKAFVIGLALLMQVMAPAIGYAAEKQGSPSLGPWAALFRHFEDPLHTSAPVSVGVTAWKAALQHLKKLPADEQMKKVNDLLNAVPYVDDLARYGSNGYWDA